MFATRHTERVRERERERERERGRERVVGEYRWKLVYTGVAQGVAQFRQELLVNARVPWLTRTALRVLEPASQSRMNSDSL